MKEIKVKKDKDEKNEIHIPSPIWNNNGRTKWLCWAFAKSEYKS